MKQLIHDLLLSYMLRRNPTGHGQHYGGPSGSIRNSERLSAPATVISRVDYFWTCGVSRSENLGRLPSAAYPVLAFPDTWTAICFISLAPTVAPASRVTALKWTPGPRAYIIMYGAIARTTLLSAFLMCSSNVLRGCPAFLAKSSAVTRFGTSKYPFSTAVSNDFICFSVNWPKRLLSDSRNVSSVTLSCNDFLCNTSVVPTLSKSLSSPFMSASSNPTSL